MIGRSAGQSAVAAAAYRSGEKLRDEERDVMQDYSRKQGIDYCEIMLPDGAPERLADRETLWNEVERSETRINSQLAREFNVALPRELTAEQQTALLRGYVQQEFVDRGMIADLAMHELDSHNPHAHVMLTTREVDSEGFTVKNRDWNRTDMLEGWRVAWQEHANAALEDAGSAERIDHRTLEAQGIDREPGAHLGKAAAMQRRGLPSYQVDRQAEINRDNAFKTGFDRMERGRDVAELEERIIWQRERDREPDQGGDEWADWRDYAAQRDYASWQRQAPDDPEIYR